MVVSPVAPRHARGVGSGALALVLGIAAVLGGLALLGSNERTHQEIAASINAHDVERAELIDGLLLAQTEGSRALN